MNHKKFMDIQRIKEGIVDNFQIGDTIYITEKIDGANAAIRYDSETNTVVAQSRKNILNISNNLRGFYEFSQALNVNKVREVLDNNLICFGEWLVPHTVKYPNEAYNNFYAFDVYNTDTEKYLSQSESIRIVNKLGLKYVPIFYIGEFQSWEHCMSFVGKTELGGEYGEGIVCKNQSRLNDPNNRQPFYLKIVGDKFKEVHQRHDKTPDPEWLKSMQESYNLCETIVTDARVTKILNKFVDEGILPENWGAPEMSIIAKNLTKAVYKDCLKEEPEIVKQIADFGKVAHKLCMTIARNKI